MASWIPYLPLNHRRSPGQPGPEDNEQDQISALNFSRTYRFVQGDGDGRGGSVTVTIEVRKKLLGPRAEAFPHGVNDAAVGLMRDDAFDFGDVKLAPPHGFRGGREHGLDGVLEGFLAFHAQVMHARGDGFRRGGTPAAAAGHV